MPAETKFAVPAFALHVVGPGEQLVEVLDAERNVQELRLTGARPKNIVMIATSLGAKEHTAIARDIGYAEFQTVTIKSDWLVQVATAKNHMIDQLRRRFLIPGTMPIPSRAASW